MSDGTWLFIALVFLAVFLLSQGMVIPVFGEGARVRRRLQDRLGDLGSVDEDGPRASILRQKYLRELSPLERVLETLPGMERLGVLIEQAGASYRAYRVLLLAVLLAVIGGFAAWIFSRVLAFALIGAVAAFMIPFLKIWQDRAARIAKFEEQMPEAIDVMKRSLKAGHPFVQSLKFVADDMDAPISDEFEKTFSDINYGSEVKTALLALMERMPSVSLMSFVTAVLVQRETGGNLAEILERISNVIRGRFKFFRRVKTLSAEGRLSAWILALVPLGLFAMISVTTPDYLPRLINDPKGHLLVGGAVILGAVGILWIRKILRIDV
ncbi:MAG: type II secretion system F family protein [Steroidobacteraceae bacterium]